MISTHRRGQILFLLITILLLATLFRPWVHGIDGTGHFSWLRSAVLDGDLDTANEYRHFDALESEWVDPFGSTIIGYHANPYPIGAALLWAPAFLVAHLLAPVLGYTADGYSPPYIRAISLSSVLLGLAGLLLLYDVARRWASPAAATWAIIAVWLSSPLLFYQFAHPSMSHAVDVFINSLVLWWWSRHDERMVRWWLVLGLLIGFAGCVRPQNMLLGLVPGLWLVASLVRDRRVRPWLTPLYALGLGALLGFAPQALVWWRVFGSPFVDVQAIAYNRPQTFDVFRPHLLEVLFSSNRGLFVWSPLLLLCTLAWPALWRYDRRAGLFLLVNAVAQTYLIASWTIWWGGAAFGARLLLGLVPFWALSLAAGFEWLRRRGFRHWALAGAAGVFATWNGLLLAQYAFGLVPRHGPADLTAMVKNQWDVLERIGTLLR